MQTVQLQSILTMAAMLLIPAGFGGAGFILLREAGRDQQHGGHRQDGLELDGLHHA